MKHKHYSENSPSDYINIVIEKQAKSLVQEILKEYNPEMIVEFGTNQGGCTLLFHETLPNARILSYDIIDNVEKRYLFNNNVIFKNEDILANELPRIANFLTKKPEKRKFLWCDNGKKTEEINKYSKYLSKGDLLGVHDYGKEVKYNDIRKSIVGKFKPVYHKEMKDINTSIRFWERR